MSKMVRTLLSVALRASSSLAVDDVVDVGYASYRSQELENGLSQWLGIRYTSAPVGDLRFMPLQDPEVHDEIQPADKVRLRLP